MSETRRRKVWGWGWEDEAPTAAERARVETQLSLAFGLEAIEPRTPPRVEDLALRPPRVGPGDAPAALAALLTDDPRERAAHSYGKSFRDVVRGLRGQYPNPPDLVATPATEQHLVQLLDWCGDAGLAAVPYGGGSSVVGGVEPPAGARGTVTLDLRRLDAVLEVDRTSRAARIQAGIFGPALEQALRPDGLTLRHFPQSFEFSTLGGWIATRAGGHFATVWTHIDDLVESLRVVTPSGVLESRRLPGSGAGPSPDRLFLGSEGTLGIVTEAWMRLQDRPRFRASAPVGFPDLERGAEAVRALAQSGLHPTNCRLLDPGEAMVSGTSMTGEAVLIVGFESADHELDAPMARALELCRDAGGTVPEGAGATRTDAAVTREGQAGEWRRTFLRGPYLRDLLVSMGLVVETFETAITWDRFAAFHAAVVESTSAAARELCGGGLVTCRFTHVYPDGPAPYYTVIAPAPAGDPLTAWDEIKAAAAEAILAGGGTITHHHAVGRDHRPWYDRQRPDAFARALRAAKAELDPRGVLNPGVLIDPA